MLGETGKGLPHIGEVLRNAMSKGRAIIQLGRSPEDVPRPRAGRLMFALTEGP